MVPLRQVAEIRTVTGPPMVRSEDGRSSASSSSTRIGPSPSTCATPSAPSSERCGSPQASGSRGWVSSSYLERAKDRLAFIIPLTLLLVFVLLYLNTRSLVETGIVLLAVPFSLIGAIWILYLLGYHMSVAVWVGLIALAGLDAETGVVMLLYLTIAHRSWQRAGRLRTAEDLKGAIVEGAAQRIRPKLMTVLTTMVGLVPVLWSIGTGADVMRRIAAPMIGGLVTSFFLELTVYPAIFAVWKGLRQRTSTSS